MIGAQARPAILFALLTLSRAARGESVPLRITYHAPSPCPDAAAFFRELESRTRRARLANGDENARVLVVDINPDQSRMIGKLTIRTSEGTSDERIVPSRTCNEVVSGLALVAALIIDPQLSQGDAPTEPEATPAAPRVLASAEAADRASVEANPPADANAPHWHGTVGLSGIARGGVAPDVAPGGALFAKLNDAVDNGLAWTLSIAAEHATSPRIETAQGNGRTSWTAGRAELCPARLHLFKETSLLPCARGEAGALTGEGLDTVNARSRTRPWIAAGAMAVVDWTSPLGLDIELAAGAVAPFRRERFFLSPDLTLEVVPPVAATARVTAGWKLF